ncbi:glycoside hydrolase family 3 C-terminal domain-containing protein [Granulicella sp. S190]|uniref:beta-glucosidase n=1 Tax=Granulicella sp. S190 TaxID=1747226 RepID=UPI00131BCF1C|nr:glycoside hydrolase family 3 C-terminal domain-containing protein [Granulicella sp. S190]
MRNRPAFARNTILAGTFLLASLSGFAQFVGNNPQAVDKRVDDLLAKMTLDEKIDLIGGDTPFRTHPVARLGIPYFQMADGPVGAHIPAPTIAYAAGIGLAASWDRNLALSIGQQLGRDSRSRGAAFLLGPGVNIYRAPMNGRNFEYFGEDPFLASAIAVGYIRGVQQEGVSATVKHYLGNNSEYLRHDSDSIIDERTLREIYMPVFEAAVKTAKVGAIMDSYNITNGEHMTQNQRLNVTVAKDQWHFPGIIMSDWVATYDTAAAVKGGLDLEMPFGVYYSKEKIMPLLKDGTITQAELDEKVRRILRVAVDFGWLDHPQLDTSIPRYNLDGRAASLQAAIEGAVLLKNENNVLPLDRKALKTIAIIGPTATQTVTTGGGSGEVVSFANTNLLVGVSNFVGPQTKVLYARGLHSVNQMSRLTHFTTDSQGTTSGVTHISFAKANLEGDVTSTATETTMQTPASTRREPEEQELNALTSHRNASPYVRATNSSRWTGYYTPAEAGKYAIFIQTDGKYRVLVDDAIVFDSSVVPKYILNQTTLDLTPTAHKVVLEQLSQQIGSVSGMRLGIAPLSSIVEPDALEMASHADAVILAVGFNAASESEGGDRTFELPVGQEQLIQQISALGKKTIVVITSGGSVDLSKWKDKVQGIFETWYAGEEGGTAAARLLFGEENPSGHLPISWEKKITDNPSFNNYYPDPGTNKIVYREGIFVGYRGYEHNHTEPQYPFGFGLSYTTFSFSKLKSSPSADGHATVTCDVTNTGHRAGATVAQLYVGQNSTTVERPTKELKAFERVVLQPGETKHLTFNLDPRSFSYYDVKSSAWQADAGQYTLLLGDSSQNTPQKTTIQLTKPITTPVSE